MSSSVAVQMGKSKLPWTTSNNKEGQVGFHISKLLVSSGIVATIVAFPLHVEQVFFVDNRDEPGWKVVLRKEVRCRWVDESVDDINSGGMFGIGVDEEYEGLQVEDGIPVENLAPPQRRRNIFHEDAFAIFEEQNDTSAQDVGDSGESSEDEDA